MLSITSHSKSKCENYSGKTEKKVHPEIWLSLIIWKGCLKIVHFRLPLFVLLSINLIHFNLYLSCRRAHISNVGVYGGASQLRKVMKLYIIIGY